MDKWSQNTAQHSPAHCISAQPSPAQRRPAQHSTGQHSTAQHSTAQRSTAQHSTAQHSTAQASTAQHSTAQHSTAQHCIPGHQLGQVDSPGSIKDQSRLVLHVGQPAFACNMLIFFTQRIRTKTSHACMHRTNVKPEMPENGCTSSLNKCLRSKVVYLHAR